VLIFERIREELDKGRATRTAVDEGFQHALSAIVDANITTLITALILFGVGTGPVRGFAVTLSIGIVASFFSALFVTRSFFLAYLSGKKASDPISI
ncbi:MAG TPA: protein translocase subunit SecD, partial [Gemmatimonadetes bacterium]|nr:protein translocase subunit SecD [Gemmatimonadota bacterium]